MMQVPNIYDLIMLLFHLNGSKSEFRGKTNVHKNLFLIGELLSKNNIVLPYSFMPYYYGPFSVEISDALDVLQSSGLIVAEDRELSPKEGIEIRQTVYRLTDYGREAADRTRASFPKFLQEFEGAFKRIHDTGYHQRTAVLAAASKIRLILNRERKAMTLPEIQQRVKELDWKLTQEDIDAAVKVLSATGLAVRKRHA